MKVIDVACVGKEAQVPRSRRVLLPNVLPLNHPP